MSRPTHPYKRRGAIFVRGCLEISLTSCQIEPPEMKTMRRTQKRRERCDCRVAALASPDHYISIRLYPALSGD